jgi:hypothetical protein
MGSCAQKLTGEPALAHKKKKDSLFIMEKFCMMLVHERKHILNHTVPRTVLDQLSFSLSPMFLYGSCT